MAAQLKLSRQDYDGGSEISSLDLYGNTAGFTVAMNGWKRKVIPPRELSVTEVIIIRVSGTSHDNLAVRIQNLSSKLLQVLQHSEDVATQQDVWLIDQITNETGARKAFIFDFQFEVGDMHSPPVSPGNFISNCKLAITRGHWERDATPTTLTSSGLSTLGGSDNYGTIVGDIPARLQVLNWLGDDGGGGPMYEFWTGFRTNRYGTVANFVPVWECEDGVLGTDASDDVTSEVNTASPGGGSGAYTEVDFASDETLVTRVTVSIENVTANSDDQRGVFAVLCRAKVDASTTCRMRLLDGFIAAPIEYWRTRDRVVVSANDWFMFPLGTVTIPPALGFTSADVLDSFALRIQAERTSGSGSLLLDALVLVPMSEGFIHVKGSLTTYVAGDTRAAEIKHFPDGSMYGKSYFSGRPRSTLEVEPQNYGLPVGNGTLYLVAQEEAEHVLANTLDMSIDYVPRWSLFRGAE